MIKVIYIYEYEFTLRDYHRFGAEYLIDKGYDVEIWIVNKNKKLEKCNINAGMYDNNNMLYLSWWNFERNVKKNKNAIYILFNYKNALYLGAMARYHCNYFLIQGTGKLLLNGVEILKVKDIKKNKVNTICSIKNHCKQKYQAFLFQLAKKYFDLQLPSYVFLGVAINDNWLKHVPKNKIIYIHSFDFDRYLEIRKSKKIEKDYILYIDSGFGNLDIDQIVLNCDDPWYGKRKKIWDKLEKVFDKLEEYYQLPILVAGHPHTKYTNDYLCNRRIIYNKTPELVVNSKFVIMQWSTTVSLALLCKKDILVLIDNDFKKIKYWKIQYESNYKFFGIIPCNMDIQEMIQQPWNYVHKVDEKIAKRYIATYIKMPHTPEKLFIEVVEDKIREISMKDSLPIKNDKGELFG